MSASSSRFSVSNQTDRREDLRRRFIKAETSLFRVRYDTDDSKEREAFLKSRDFNWIAVFCYLHGMLRLLTFTS